MMIRTDKQEMVDVIKDMTKALPDCGHLILDPDSCYICYGKILTKADDEGNLIIRTNGERNGHEGHHHKSSHRRGFDSVEAFYTK